ncbi:hypothetical protein B1R94_28885 [Mycolicibacterium litorale]|nr:hypothetical protein B1R94_28885 [Mycolicibacterium litorale]
MNFWRQPESHGWCAQLSVRVPSRQRLTLVIERCNRLIDVVEAVELADHDPRRQSVYVQMVTDATDWVRIVEIITSFGAEIVAARTDQVVLHLCGTPDHCAAFIWMLRSYDLLDCMASAVFAFPADASASGSAGSRPHVHAS